MKSKWLAACIFALIHVQAKADGCLIKRQASLPITFNGFVPTVPAHINRHPVNIGVDTGSSTTVLTPETVKRLNLSQDDNGHATVIGSVGDIRSNNVLLDSLEFGGAVELLKNTPVLEIGESRRAPSSAAMAEAPSPDTTLAGLIGTELLSDYDVEFRFPAHRLNLYRVSNCEKVMPPWEGRYRVIPVTLSETKRFVVPLELDGHRVTAIFDTGSSGLRISRAAALRIGVTVAMLAQDPVQLGARAGGNRYRVPSHTFRQITIGGETFSGPRIDVVDFPLAESDMLIGEDYMHARRFWLSYATKMLFIQRLRILPVGKHNLIGHNSATPSATIGD